MRPCQPIFAALVLLTLAVAFSPASAAAPPVIAANPPNPLAPDPPRRRFQSIHSYCCYYGPDQTAALAHVDAAILHTPAQTPANIAHLNSLGDLTLGYLSVGEDESLRVGNGRGLGGKASWYFDRNHAGTPDRNGTWGSYFANAADPTWRADRLAQAKRLTGDAPGDWEFAGLFLDTIETVDAYPQSRTGMIQLVAQLRAALPDKVIVINRGFSLLNDPALCRNIDGLMYESFTDTYDFATRRYLRLRPADLDATRTVMVSTVMPAMKKYGLRVLALDYCEPNQTARIQEAFDRAATFGMLPAVSPISLDAIYDTRGIIAHPSPRFLLPMPPP